MKRKMCGRPLLSCLLAVLLCIGAAPAQAAETPASEKSGAVNWVETVDEGILQEPVEIPILMYHNLVAEEDDPSISKNTMWVGQFQHQMELLEENGFTTITVDQLVEFGNRGKALPEKPVLITFDDGYRSAYELAFPILQEMDFHAAMFPIGVSVGKDTYKDTGLAMVPHFSWEEAKEMAESGLVSIQSHTYDMHQWEAFETAGGGQCLRPNILRQPWETLGEYMQALWADVERARQDIVEGTGQEAVALAYPGGLHDQISEELLRSYGVKCTFTIEGGKAQVTPGSERSLYGLNRFYVKPTTTDEEFLQWVG